MIDITENTTLGQLSTFLQTSGLQIRTKITKFSEITVNITHVDYPEVDMTATAKTFTDALIEALK